MTGAATGGVTLITGGAGFVGSNLADRLLAQGRRVRVLDSLQRPGVEQNLQWLRRTHGDALEVSVADVRDARAVREAVAGATQVYHFAAQVAVTTSLADPREDFEVNAAGTLNVLEAVRASDAPPPLLLTSTNKVYGGLADVPLVLEGQRYLPQDAQWRARGVSEARPLDFHSPYGCSKGTADQYAIDYARSYGLTTLVFRMSCIYGPRQFGTEDQGWVAHFLLRALRGERITLYGDGRQVRDILFVDDLVDAFLLAERNAPRLCGRAFNIGGGPANTISLLDLVDRIEQLHGTRPGLEFDAWRTGDQRYYVSDTGAFEAATGWRPRVDTQAGIERLYGWLAERERGSTPAARRAHTETEPEGADEACKPV
ncbi:NAD-dependent epimerase/dehydratase family protein [Ramlibacter rhizophilus]|uniref:NAD-dependent epimerase/dehydratase family protein n=1 Tax=Ramlibacter rhizophilus TaxID=1781167 RepID=A0A4Z0C290_9BURK|nr:NAD-dependent epimerase/dehydratase family protein [Ramlibacter rhizophilus]TFZ04339.1 NAD-dependent epimerase/dehydratase family protein [Ramlibacter rhizophilus]